MCVVFRIWARSHLHSHLHLPLHSYPARGLRCRQELGSAGLATAPHARKSQCRGGVAQPPREFTQALSSVTASLPVCCTRSDLLPPRVCCQPGPACMHLLASGIAPLQIKFHFRAHCVGKVSATFLLGRRAFTLRNVSTEHLCVDTCPKMTTQAIAILLPAAYNQGEKPMFFSKVWNNMA